MRGVSGVGALMMAILALPLRSNQLRRRLVDRAQEYVGAVHRPRPRCHADSWLPFEITVAPLGGGVDGSDGNSCHWLKPK